MCLSTLFAILVFENFQNICSDFASQQRQYYLLANSPNRSVKFKILIKGIIMVIWCTLWIRNKPLQHNSLVTHDFGRFYFCFIKNDFLKSYLFGEICQQTDLFGELSVRFASQLVFLSEQIFHRTDPWGAPGFKGFSLIRISKILAHRIQYRKF